MNPLPPNADELVSAYLDGQAAPDEVVIVESSPELLERVEELRAVSDALAAPVAGPPAQKQAHLSAALDLFDRLVAEGDFTNGTGTAESEADGAAAAPVVSLESARERRRPRRFNTGVIAAAVAALLLFVGVAALSFGRGTGSDDVADSQSEAVAADESADDTADTAAMEAAASDALDSADDAGEGGAAIAESADSERSADPRPEASAQAVPPADSAEDASNTAMDDADDAGSSAPEMEESDGDELFAADAEPLLFDLFIGEYADLDDLVVELEALGDDALLARAAGLDAGLLPGCRPEIPELRDVESPTLVGRAVVDAQLVEIHAFEPHSAAGRSAPEVLELIIVDAADCSPILTID